MESSSPSPTPSSLPSRLARFQERLQKAQAEVAADATVMLNTTAHEENDNPNASFHLGLQLFADVNHEALEARLRDLEEEFEDVLAVDQNDTANNTDEHTTDPATLQSRIASLKQAQRMRTLLDDALHAATPALSPDTTDRVTAAQKLVQAHAVWAEHKADGADNDTDDNVALWQHLIDTWRQQKVKLLDWTKATVRKSIVVGPHELRVQTGPALTEAWTVLQVWQQNNDNKENDTPRHNHDETLNHIMRHFTENLTKQVLSKGWELTMPAVFTETEERSTLGLNKASWQMLTWEFPQDQTGKQSSISLVSTWQHRLAFWQRVLTFVAERVCLERPVLTALIQKALAPTAEKGLHLTDKSFAATLLDKLHATCLPKDDETTTASTVLAVLPQRQAALQAAVTGWEEALVAKGMWPADGRISTWTNNLTKHYVQHRRSQHLCKVRTLLQTADYHNSSLVGDEEDGQDKSPPVFGLPRAAVSMTAQQVVAHVRACLDEAVSPVTSCDDPITSTDLPATLYQAARESLDLLRALLPVRYRHEIATVPRTAALWHNDCVYAAYQCQILGLEYQARWTARFAGNDKDAAQKMRQRTFGFVDMVPAWRSLADETLQKMLDRQGSTIHSLVADQVSLLGKALRSNEILAEWSQAEMAIAAAVTHLRQLSQAWKPVLSYDVFHRCLCFLADIVFTLLLQQLLAATDISTTACQFVHTAFGQFERDAPITDWRASRVHGKFMACRQCLDMSLSDIRLALSQGVFQQVSGQELSKLVQATFDPSAKRQELLQLLHQAG